MILKANNNRAVIELYSSIAKQSEAMLIAAKNGNWDSLCEAEERCSAIIHQLQQLKQNQEAQLNEDERIEHISYLKKILADDAAIRNITEPHLRQLEEFLRAANNNQRLSNSYGTN
jgi:flagellar protein FliT